jgi:hypothetical protein
VPPQRVEVLDVDLAAPHLDATGLSAEKLLQAIFRPALEDVAWFGDLCERLELEADRAATEKCWEALAAHWQRIVERG